MTKRVILPLITVLFFSIYSDLSGEDRSWKKKELAEKLKIIDDTGGDHLGYCKEILSMLENTCGIKCGAQSLDYFDEIDRFDEQKEGIDLYSIFSGGLSLRNNLQLETVPASSDYSGTIDPASLSSPAYKKINYADMIKGKKVRTFPMDKYTPADFYYIHFTDAGKISELLNYLDETAGAAQRQLSSVSVDFMTREKIVTQLALKDSKEFNDFYRTSIDDIVISGSDPFIIEGSDVSLIIRAKDSQRFINTVNSFRREYKERYRCEEKNITVAGVNGNTISSRDRKVNSLMFTLPDGTIIITNSAGAAGIVLETYMGRHPSLAEAPDYLYMRTLFPAENSEDAFIYISDSFVKHLSSPLLKIKEARRMRAAMKLAVLEKYAVYYSHLTGKKSSSIEEVLSVIGDTSLNASRKKELAAIKKNPAYGRARDLENEYLDDWGQFESKLSVLPVQKKRSKKSRRRDSGAGTLTNAMKVFYRNMTGSSAGNPEAVMKLIGQCEQPGGFNSKRFSGITLDEDTFRASDSSFGRIGYMTPCIDMGAILATEGEAEDYKDFARNFSSYTESSLSPAGIKLNMQNGFSAEAFFVRTDTSPFYSFISAFTGGTPVTLHPDSAGKGDVLSIAFKLDNGLMGRYLSQSGVRITSKTGKPLEMNEIFSGELQVHMGDTLPPATFNSSSLRQLISGDGYGSADAVSGLVIWSLFHPVRIALPVKNSEYASRFIEAVKKTVIEKSDSSSIYQSDSFSFEYNGADIKVLKLTILKSLSARVYFTVKNGMLHIVTNEKYMKNILDMKEQKQPGIKGNASAVIRPSEMLQEMEIYRSGVIEDAMIKSMKNFGTVKLASILYPDAKYSELPDLVYRNFGFRPVCPLGGEYILERKNGEVSNSAFGTYREPLLRSGIKENGLVHNGIKRFFSTKEIRAEVEFTPDGMKTRFSTK